MMLHVIAILALMLNVKGDQGSSDGHGSHSISDSNSNSYSDSVDSSHDRPDGHYDGYKGDEILRSRFRHNRHHSSDDSNDNDYNVRRGDDYYVDMYGPDDDRDGEARNVGHYDYGYNNGNYGRWNNGYRGSGHSSRNSGRSGYRSYGWRNSGHRSGYGSRNGGSRRSRGSH